MIQNILLLHLLGFCVCSLFCCAMLCVLSSFAIILMGKKERELVAKFRMSSLCLVTVFVLRLFLAVLWVGLQRVIVVFPDYTHLPF